MANELTVWGTQFEKLMTFSAWLDKNILTLSFWLQLVIISICFLMARQLAAPYRGQIKDWVIGKTKEEDPWLRRLGVTVDGLLLPFVWIVLLWSVALFSWIGHQNWIIIRNTASLLVIWIIIHLLSSIIVNSFWQKFFAVFAWSVVAMEILGLLQPTIEVLDAVRFTVGTAELTLYKIVKAGLLSIGTLWLAFSLSHILQSRLLRVSELSPSARILIIKIARTVLIALAVLASLNAVGIDLTAFAVFSGALGIGIGFGLQKVVANFVSGIILLMDRSIRPDDVIEIGQTVGKVKSLGARYTSVITRSGREYLIPNENMITQEVINWSYSDTNVRRKIPIGVAYNADVELARTLVIEAARETRRVISYPEPICHLIGFGDNSVDLEARFWIADPENGLMNVQSDFLRKVWKKFKENQIEIPFPQRDLNIRGGEVIRVAMVSADSVAQESLPKRDKNAAPEPEGDTALADKAATATQTGQKTSEPASSSQKAGKARKRRLRRKALKKYLANR